MIPISYVIALSLTIATLLVVVLFHNIALNKNRSKSLLLIEFVYFLFSLSWFYIVFEEIESVGIRYTLITIFSLIFSFILLTISYNFIFPQKENIPNLNKEKQYTTETLVGMCGEIISTYSDGGYYLGNLFDEAKTSIVVKINGNVNCGNKFLIDKVCDGYISAVLTV